MAQKTKTELRKTDFLVIRSQRNDDILKIVTPQNYQIGLDDVDFEKTLDVKGVINATGKIESLTRILSPELSGSLQTLTDGTSFLRAGGNISIVTGSNGSITISASGFSESPLTLGNGLVFSSGTEYDGTAAKTLSLSPTTTGGIGALAGGVRIDFNELNTAAVTTSDLVIFGDVTDGISGFPRKTTVGDILALGSAATLGNPLTIGQGLQLNTAASSYDNSQAATILIATASSGGLTISSDALKIDLDGSTLSLGASGISVASVPNSLTQGTGISTFTFDGSSATTVGIDTSVVPRLSVNNTFSGNNTLSGDNALSGDNTFSGKNTFGVSTSAGLTGSLQEVSAGVPYLVGGSNVTVETGSNGQVTIAATLGAGGSLTDGSGIGSFTYNGTGNASVALDATGLSETGGRSNYLFLSDGGSTITKRTVAALIDQVDRTAVMVEGTGIDITFNGNSNPATIATKLDSSTLGTDGSGNITVTNVPNSLSQGTGIKAFSFDGSTAQTVTIDNSVVATLTGSQFSGNVGVTGSLEVEGLTAFRGGVFGSKSEITGNSGVTGSFTALGGMSGSLQTLSDGTAYIRAGENISITSGSEGWIKIDATMAGGAAGGGNSDKRAQYLVLAATASLTDERVLTMGTGLKRVDAGAGGLYTVSIRDDTVATLTGSIFSGAVVAQSGLSGSLQMLSDGSTPYMVGTGSVSITTASSGQLIISSAVGDITSVQAGNGLTGGGSAGTVSLAVDNSVVATLTGSVFSGAVVAQTGLSGSLQLLSDGSTPYIIGTGSLSVITGANGQLVISSSGASGGSVAVQQVGQTIITDVSHFVFTSSTVTNNGAGKVTIGPVIGRAEDGTYTDGLFTDFTYNTEIGVAIDRFNEVLLELGAAPSPTLDNINTFDTGIAAYLSFGTSAAASGFTDVAASAGLGSAVDVNGLYQVATSSNNIRAGIFDGSIVFDGILNSDVASASYSNGQLNYSEDSFGDANKGKLQLEVNGAVVHTIDLTSATVGSGVPGSGTGSSLNANSSGFFELSQTGSAKFSDGSLFTQFQHRTGKWKVGTSDQRDGWNYARVSRVANNTTSSLTNYIEWVNDSNSEALVASNNKITAVDIGGFTKLSGVKYFKSGSVEYRVDVSNAYKTCYDTNPITFTTTNLSISNIAKPTINTGGGENSGKILTLTGSGTITDETLLSGSVAASVSVTHPIKANLTNAGSTTAGGFLLWNVSDTSTNTEETFRGESYRLQSGSFANQTDVTGGSYDWNSAIHMTGSGGHADGLLYYNYLLVGPDEGINNGDFRSTANGGNMDFAPAGNPDYSGIGAGIRTFYRKFRNTTGGTANSYTVALAGSTDLQSYDISSNIPSDSIRLFARLPDDGTSTSNTTGWLDCTELFTSGTYTTFSGCRVYTDDTTVPATLYCTFGAKNIRNNDYLVLKVEANGLWDGNLSNMTVSFTNSNASDSADLSQISSADDGVDAKLSFGSSKAIPGFTIVGAGAGVGNAVNTNGEYVDGSPNANRLGIFSKTTAINGPLNTDSSTTGFGEGDCGTLKFEVNGSEIAAAEIELDAFAGSGYPGSGGSSAVNASGTGFTNISTKQPKTGSNNFPDFNKWFRTAQFNVAAADQRDGWNYARAIHTVDGVDRTTNYVEWVNDPYTTAMSFSSIGFADFGGSTIFYLSGVKYFDNTSSTVTGSLKAELSGSHSNIYSKLSNAFSTTALSNISVSTIAFSGSGYVEASHNSDATVPLPAIDTAFADAQSNDLHITASYVCTLTDSLPEDADSISAKFRVYHPQKSTLTSPAQTKSTFLIFSASDSSSVNIAENFSGEKYRLKSSSFNAKSDVTDSSYDWDSQQNMNTVAGYDDGLLIYDGKLFSPLAKGDSGDFRNVADGGLYQGPDDNVDYSTLTNAVRTYYRAFRNDTTSDLAQITIQMTGSAEIIPRSGGFATGSLGANSNIHFDVKIPGKTAWLDLGKAGSGAGTFGSDGNGCLKGSLVGTVTSNGAANICSFQGETANGTGGGSVPAAASDYVLIRINAHKNWTGNLNTLKVTWS